MAGAIVLRKLLNGTQGTGHLPALRCALVLRPDDLRWRDALFDPLLERRVYAVLGPLRGGEAKLPEGAWARTAGAVRSEEHTSELQSHLNLVCRLLLEKKK